MKKGLLTLAVLLVSSLAHAESNPQAAENFLCQKAIQAFVKKKFPSERDGAGYQRLHSILMHKSEYRGAIGDVDIELHALFDDEGYIARRIFLGADGITDNNGHPIGCRKLWVKASYFDPLAE